MQNERKPYQFRSRFGATLALLAIYSTMLAISAGAEPARKDSSLKLKPKEADLKTSVEPAEVKPGGTLTYRVHVKLQPGWKMFPFNAQPPLRERPFYARFDLFDTDGLTIASDWSASRPAIKKEHALFGDQMLDCHEGEVTWSIELKVPEDAGAGKRIVQCQAGYQLFTDSVCTCPGRWTLPQATVTVVP